MEKEYSELIKEHIQPVYNLIFRLTGKVLDAEDLTQETFLKAWKHRINFDQEKNFKTWLFTIARNTVTDFFRKKKSFPFSSFNGPGDDKAESFESQLPSIEPLPDEIFEKQEEESVLRSALENLTADEKTIIILHHTDGLTFGEIGEVVDRPMNTVKSIYRRALMKLRKIIMHQNVD